ncbi:hypothetical protein [Kitasatospora sp. NBC_01266]|uniref:hypothetical protein n=1 Tax=Kitasatospora sp. NBC_01266 TaxID=2903572 RepID=UPI002E3511E1|nr:hypothetical protein [Kitasatospora sp. NBC_01266]
MVNLIGLVGRRRFAALTLGLAGIAGLMGCTNKGGSSEAVTVQPSSSSGGMASTSASEQTALSAAPSPSSPAPSWTGVPAPPEALAAYDAMMQDITALAATSDYKNPRLASHMTGQPLTYWTKALIDQHTKGLVSHGAPVWNPRVTKVTPADQPDRVEVADCLDGTHWLKYKLDGQLADDVPGGKHISAAAITRQPDGSWQVDQQLIGAVGTC